VIHKINIMNKNKIIYVMLAHVIGNSAWNFVGCYLAKLKESSMSPARSVALKTCKKSFIHVVFMPGRPYF